MSLFITHGAWYEDFTYACASFRLNLAGSAPAPEIWLNVLTRMPKWNVDKSILYLLDVVARATWPDPVSAKSFQQILSVMLQESSKVQRPSKGLASRVGSWVSGSTEAVGHVDATELIPPNPSMPYLSWMVLELELERQAKLWRILVVELQPGKQKGLDQALKSAATTLKIPWIGVVQLCLVRYAQLAVEMSLEHPLLPLIVQRFFSLYFSRAETLDIDIQTWAVGQRIMTHSSALSSLLKRLALSWTDGIQRLQESNPQLSAFFKSCLLWLEDVKLLEPQIYLPSLPPSYHSSRLLQLFQGSELWLELCRLDIIGLERLKLREVWNKERNPTGSMAVVQHPSRFQSAGDTLVSRIQNCSTPVELVQVVIQPPFFRLPPAAFYEVDELHRHLNRHLNVVTNSAEQFVSKTAELTALDCQYAELLAEQFAPTRTERQVAVKCAGTQTTECSGAAVIRLTCEPWRISASVRSQAEDNRQEASRLRSSFQDSCIQELCAAALLVDDCVEIIKASADPAVLDVGAALFYILVELVNDDTNSYPPTKQLLSTCLESLGNFFRIKFFVLSCN